MFVIEDCEMHDWKDGDGPTVWDAGFKGCFSSKNRIEEFVERFKEFYEHTFRITELEPDTNMVANSWILKVGKECRV